MTCYYETEHKRGVRREDDLKELLRHRGFDVTSSTKHDDTVNDIDCYVNGAAISIKAPKNFNQAGEFGFETTKSKRDGSVRPSWLWTSKADYFMFVYPDNSVWSVDVAMLRQHLQVHLSYRTASLRPENKQALLDSVGRAGNPYTYVDATTVWISKVDLRNLGIATKVVQSQVRLKSV